MIVCLVSIFKFSFLKVFVNTSSFISKKHITFANRVSLRRFWISLPAKKCLEAEIADIFDYVSHLLAFEIVSWNWPLPFSNQFVEWLILLEDFFLIFWFGSYLGKRTNWSFPGIHRVLICLEFPYIPTKFETLHLRSMWQSTQFVCYKKSS